MLGLASIGETAKGAVQEAANLQRQAREQHSSAHKAFLDTTAQLQRELSKTLEDSIRPATQQLGSLAGRGPIWFDSSNPPVFDNWSTSVLAELVRRDIEFTVNEPGLVRQFGNRRRSQGDSPVRLRLFHGAAAFNPPPEGEVVALWSLLTPSQQQRFSGLQDRRTLGDSLTQSELAEFDQLLATANSGSIAAVIDRGP